MRQGTRSLALFHRLTGACVALPVLVLVATGVPLQFTGPLGLGQHGVPWAWVHDSYGIGAPQQVSISNGAVQIADTLLTSSRAVTLKPPMVGALALEVVTLVVTRSEVVLIPTDTNAPVERADVPGPVTAFGETPDFELVIDTPQGLLYSADLGASWRPGEALGIEWHAAESVAAQPQWQARYRAAHLSWERWLQDLHSGRYFGPVGEWVMALAGLALVGLALSGLITWMLFNRERQS